MVYRFGAPIALHSVRALWVSHLQVSASLPPALAFPAFSGTGAQILCLGAVSRL